MIDIHSHIMPYIDDGADDLETALEMLRMAKDASTSAVVLTPHSNLYKNGKNFLYEMSYVFQAFKQKVEKESIGIDVYLGGEVFADDNILDYAKKHMLPTINNSRFMLVEFDFFCSASEICSKVNALSNMGYVPIVAHPERYECVKKSPSISLDIMTNGGLLQINKGSLTDEFGSTVRICALELLHHKAAQFVASDAHSTNSRTTDMELAYDIVAAEMGEAFAQKLFKQNPLSVIHNQTLAISRPISFRGNIWKAKTAKI